MDKNKVKIVDALNKVVHLENKACMQYKQYALMVRGLWRLQFSDFFMKESLASHDHAAKFGQKIVALGGVPTAHVGGVVSHTTDITDMLHVLLGVEKAAMTAYLEAFALASCDVALSNMLEDQIDIEQRDIEELELFLQMVDTDYLQNRDVGV